MKNGSIKYVESEYRHRCLSDGNIHYAIIKNTGTIHEKNCSVIKRLLDKEISFEVTANSDFKCDECKARASIRLGAKDGDIAEHERFFRKVGASSDQIVRMYVDKGIKTTIMSNILTIWYKEDVWKIRIVDKSNYVELKHNNYRRVSGKKREFVPGFHIQNGNVLFYNAIDYIYKYDYLDHFKDESCIVEHHEEHYEEHSYEVPKQSIMGKLLSRFVFAYLKKHVFHDISKKMPFPNRRSLIIYEGRDGQERIRAGAYCPDDKCFTISYAGKFDTVKLKKVKYWVVMDELDFIFKN